MDQTNSLGVIRLEVLGPNVLVLDVLVLNSCAYTQFGKIDIDRKVKQL